MIVPARSDSRIVGAAARSYFDELLAAGVRVFEYQPRMLHSKALLVDDDTCIIGSANFDHRSFRLNFEVTALVYDPDEASLLRMLQVSYMEESDDLFLEDWIRRPTWT